MIENMPVEPRSKQYLDNALSFSEEEEALFFEFNKWLPDLIIDCHAHANGKEAVQELSSMTLKQVRSSFPDYSIEDSIKVKSQLYLHSKDIRMVRFANPYKGINHRVANAYLLSHTPSQDRVALCGLPNYLDYTIEEIHSGNYVALKMYPFYFEPPAKIIKEFFPPPVLEATQNMGIPIILHTPVPLANCIDELLHIVQEFPELKIIIAHLGRHNHATRESLLSFEAIAPYPYIVTDISMATSVGVMKQALDILGPERILFGSDEPMNLLRYVRYEHPKLGDRLVSTYPYHWLDNQQRLEFGHLADRAVHVHWQVLASLRAALDEVFGDGSESIKPLIFSQNAMRIFPHL